MHRGADLQGACRRDPFIVQSPPRHRPALWPLPPILLSPVQRGGLCECCMELHPAPRLRVAGTVRLWRHRISSCNHFVWKGPHRPQCNVHGHERIRSGPCPRPLGSNRSPRALSAPSTQHQAACRRLSPPASSLSPRRGAKRCLAWQAQKRQKGFIATEAAKGRALQGSGGSHPAAASRGRRPGKGGRASQWAGPGRASERVADHGSNGGCCCKDSV